MGSLMGQRSVGATITAILQAFVRRNTWSQAELARALGQRVPAVRKRLEELREGGIPFERQEEHPHVYWSVPSRWFPGGVVLDPELAQEVTRLALSAPRSQRRTKVLTRLVRSRVAGPAPLREVEERVRTRAESAPEQAYLGLLVDAALARQSVELRYFSSSRGALGTRTVSVHRVLPGPPARFVGVCHEHDELRWFRVDNVIEARTSRAPFRPWSEVELERFVESSVDGFHGARDGARVTFTVRAPEARWVRMNLPEGLRALDAPDGAVRVEADTSALVPIARYVVGLGAAARAETEALRALVAELARGALASLALERPAAEGTEGSEGTEGGTEAPPTRHTRRSSGHSSSSAAGRRTRGTLASSDDKSST